MDLPILNHARPAEGGWYHVVPKGKFPHPESGLVQVLDEAAHAAIVNRFAEESKQPKFPGLLVDQEHFSYEPDKSSAAFGWLKELQNRADGTWARIDWTPAGKAAVEGGTYRFISPVWLPVDVEKLGNKEIRPKRLDSVGLTNQPNLRGMAPLANRGTTKASAGARRPCQEGLVFMDETQRADRALMLANRLRLRNGISFEDGWAAVKAEHPTLIPETICLRGTSTGALVNRASAGTAAFSNDAQVLIEQLRPLKNRLNPTDMRPVSMEPPPTPEGSGLTTAELLDMASEFEADAYDALQQASDGRDMMPMHQFGGAVRKIFTGLMRQLQIDGMSFDQAWAWARANQPVLLGAYILQNEDSHVQVSTRPQ